ncbi:hypothetical protein GOV13_03405 [Candidatus Pacearchaeota archaeon]|nr:hypothetical protein [Candidatus Pacearchaeota archaeon]
MGQDDILQVLKQHPGREFTEKEIRTELGRTHYIRSPLRSLRKYPPNNLQIKQTKGYRNFEIFVYCWRAV